MNRSTSTPIAITVRATDAGRERPQRVGLDLAVLEAPELVLQALERLDGRLDTSAG